MLVSLEIKDYGYDMDYFLHIEDLEVLVGLGKDIFELR
jgi:hypothetical protein